MQSSHHIDNRPLVTRATTRSIDILVGLAIAVITAPLVLVAAMGAAWALRTSPLFVQERVGRGGQRFRLAKIRTLPGVVPTDVDKYALTDFEVPQFTQRLRDLHVDELPQLLAVIRGSMALVGPRPEIPALHGAITVDAAERRERARPGCTGLWQISPAAKGLIHEASEYDSFYVDHGTARLDLWILYRTAILMVRPSRTVGLDDIPQWSTRRLGRQRVRQTHASLGGVVD